MIGQLYGTRKRGGLRRCGNVDALPRVWVIGRRVILYKGHGSDWRQRLRRRSRQRKRASGNRS